MSKADQLRQLREQNYARGTNRQTNDVRQRDIDRRDAVRAKAKGAAQQKPELAGGGDVPGSARRKPVDPAGSIKDSGTDQGNGLRQVMSAATAQHSRLSGQQHSAGTGASGVEGSTPSVSTKSKRGGRPLAKDADKAIERTRPWEAERISRRTWYRRKAEEHKP